MGFFVDDLYASLVNEGNKYFLRIQLKVHCKLIYVMICFYFVNSFEFVSKADATKVTESMKICFLKNIIV